MLKRLPWMVGFGAAGLDTRYVHVLDYMYLGLRQSLPQHAIICRLSWRTSFRAALQIGREGWLSPWSELRPSWANVLSRFDRPRHAEAEGETYEVGKWAYSVRKTY